MERRALPDDNPSLKRLDLEIVQVKHMVLKFQVTAQNFPVGLMAVYCFCCRYCLVDNY